MISWRWCRCWCWRCRWGVLLCCLLVTAAAVITRYYYWSGAARHGNRIIVRCALWQAPHVVAARRRTSGHSAFGGPAWCGPLISSVILIVRMCLEWRPPCPLARSPPRPRLRRPETPRLSATRRLRQRAALAASAATLPRELRELPGLPTYPPPAVWPQAPRATLDRRQWHFAPGSS